MGFPPLAPDRTRRLRRTHPRGDAAPSIVVPAQQTGGGQPAPVQFGGSYSALDGRRKQLVDDWVARFAGATNQKQEPGPFYDEQMALSSKTTFDAITYALERTTLTDAFRPAHR